MVKELDINEDSRDENNEDKVSGIFPLAKTIFTFTKDKSKIGTTNTINGITEKFIYCGSSENDNPTECYDKFTGKNGDVYTVNLEGDKFVISCPTGKSEHLKLLFKPICGVDALDDARLCKFIDKLSTFDK